MNLGERLCWAGNSVWWTQWVTDEEFCRPFRAWIELWDGWPRASLADSLALGYFLSGFQPLRSEPPYVGCYGCGDWTSSAVHPHAKAAMDAKGGFSVRGKPARPHPAGEGFLVCQSSRRLGALAAFAGLA